MFVINEEDNSIYITRGDVAFFSVSTETEEGEAYKFQAGDVVRFKVFGKKNCENVVLQKDFGIEEETEEAEIYLEESDTKIGGVISKPVDYWYEVELNPYTNPQTIIGYDDEDGAKIFRLFPEGAEAEDDDEPITPEDIPVVDEELSLTSTRPVQNQAISRAIARIKSDVEAELESHSEGIEEALESHSDEINEIVGEFESAFTEIEGLRIEVVDDFLIDGSGLTCEVIRAEVVKQGNFIFGTIYLKTIDNSECFGIAFNEKYKPLCDVHLAGAGARLEDGERFNAPIFGQILRGATELYFVSYDERGVDECQFSFSYIFGDTQTEE